MGGYPPSFDEEYRAWLNSAAGRAAMDAQREALEALRKAHPKGADEIRALFEEMTKPTKGEEESDGRHNE